LLAITAVFVFGMTVADARAEVKIDITPEDDPLFDVEDAAPGDSETKEIKATNEGTDAQDLFINIDDITGDDLADEIKFYLKDKSSGDYLIGGEGDRFTLKEIHDEGDVFVERLDPGEDNTYEMKLELDENAGNEFQDKKSEFDIVFGFNDESVPLGAPLPLRTGPAGGETAGEIIVGGEGTPGEEGEGEVAGEEECVPVAWWIFALMLLAYWVVMYFNLFYRMKESENIRWFWEAVYTILALVGWYYLDRCRTNVWFVYAALVSGFILYLIYLYLLKKKMESAAPPQDKLPLE